MREKIREYRKHIHHGKFESDLRHISLVEYKERLIGKEEQSKKPQSISKAERAFEFVVDTRKFEIDLYWKRATYFWAFIASAFAGYIALEAADESLLFPKFVIVCLGLMLSVAWHLSNLGSKQWQRHWEKHLDLLEDDFVGPLYKTVYHTKTFSVSKINSIVSFSVSVSWVLLGFYVLWENNLIHLRGFPRFEFIVAAILTFIGLYSMIGGYGRGRFKTQKIKMYAREFNYIDPKED